MAFTTNKRVTHIYIVGITLIAFCFILPSLAQLQCRSDSNSKVDWWIGFKYPNNRSYSYTDSFVTSQTVSTSKKSFTTGSTSCLNYTLSQLWSTSKKSYMFYNDQPPGSAKRSVYDEVEEELLKSFDVRESVDYAHAKGIVAVDEDGYGFWLIHSTPLFPLAPIQTNSFKYMDDSQVTKGQNYLCVSFKTWGTFDSIGGQLQVMKPDVYAQVMTSKAQTNAPSLYQSAVNNVYYKNATAKKATLTSTSGTKFASFSKSGYYGSGWDLYSEYVSPQLKQSLAVETWRQGVGTPLSSNCSVTGGRTVVNVNQLTMNGNSWKYTSDHSKWAISTGSSWFCGCDINRMASQGKRGGGCLCFQNTGLYNFVSKAITDKDKCPTKKRSFINTNADHKINSE